jgi:hypothetical protein
MVVVLPVSEPFPEGEKSPCANSAATPQAGDDLPPPPLPTSPKRRLRFLGGAEVRVAIICGGVGIRVVAFGLRGRRAGAVGSLGQGLILVNGVDFVLGALTRHKWRAIWGVVARG